jgi:hypothetical protein
MPSGDACEVRNRRALLFGAGHFEKHATFSLALRSLGDAGRGRAAALVAG